MKKYRMMLFLFCFPFFVHPIYFFANDVESTERQEIIFDDVDNAGTYPVVVKYISDNGIEIEEVFYITITYLRTVVSDVYQEAIDAHDVKVEKKLFESLQDYDLIHLANAHAWNTQNGEFVEITSVKKYKLRGQYNLTFSTENQTSTTVHVILVDDVKEDAVIDSIYIEFDEMPSFVYFQFSIMLLTISPIILFYFNYLQSKKKMKEIDNLLYQNEEE